MKKLLKNPVVLIVLGVLALDVALHLLGAWNGPTPRPWPEPIPQQIGPQYTTSQSLSGIIGGVMVLLVLYAFFSGIGLAFRGWRNFDGRMKRDGVWKRDRK